MLFKMGCYLLALFYCVLIGIYVAGWLCLPTRQTMAAAPAPKTSISVIIPARNEAANIETCLRAILTQQYPSQLLEIIVVDDHSTDNTANIVQQLAKQYPQIKLLTLQAYLPHANILNAYKKKAIEIAISNSTHELIVTTDADCFAQPQWLHTLAAFYEQYKPQLIAAPVCFTHEQSFFERFQTLDFIGMMVSTGASVHWQLANMCNGANLAYTRKAFNAVNGFAGIDHLASGDDMLLMAKISKQFPGELRFLKNRQATIFTYAQPTVADFVQQRIRWASKSGQYQDKRIIFFLAAVFLFNLSVVANLGLCLCGFTEICTVLTVQLCAKFVADFIYLGVGAHFFGRCKLLWLFLPAQMLHIAYIVIIGIWGNLGKYHWKGRQVK